MTLLDRFRGQPEWQHEDPLVRTSAVDELEDDAQDLLTALASEDADPGVRAAAVVRLSDPEILGRIVRTDQDGGVRAEAVAMLRMMAVDDTDAERAAGALAGLSEARDLGEVARTARLEAISGSALERLDGQKTISAVARRSAHPAIRRAALARLDDRDELVAVAVKSDHKDIALAAFDQLAPGGPEDRERLKTIAVQARTKPVARRARTALTALDAQPTPPSQDELRGRRERLCESVEALTSADDRDLVSGGLAQAEREWRSLDEALALAASTDRQDEGGGQDARTDLDTADAVVRERWTTAGAQLREHLTRLDLARSEAARLSQARRAAVAARLALCEQLAVLVADETRAAQVRMAELARVRDAWQALPDVPRAGDAGPADEGPGIERRFEVLVARAEGQVRQQRSAADRIARLTQLAGALEAISETAAVDLKTAWTGPYREWTELVEAATPDEVAELARRVQAAEARRAERLKAAREERRRREQANLAKQQRRCDELERALGDENLALNDAERWQRTTRSVLGNLGRLPTRGDRDALTKRLRQAQSALRGRVRELRGFAEWKQWANLGVQVALCRRLEALVAVDDDAVVAKEFRQVMVAWRQASDVSRGEGEEIWRRFKTAHDAIHPRAEAFLAKEGAVREEHFAQKVALCEEAERLAESTDWLKTAQRMTELQEQWKQIGSATRKQDREVWNRFRAACGRFFRRRRDDLAERKQAWAKNATLKEALCEKAETVAGESDLGVAREILRQLQAEWKMVGPTRRTRSEALWQRFRTACDRVYTRAQEASDAEFADKITARASVCERLEALVSRTSQTHQAGDTGLEPPDDVAETVAAARAEWRQLPPVPRPQERSLTARFQTALTGVVERYPAAFSGSDLDPERNRVALERLCGRVEALLEDTMAPSAAGGSPAEILAARLRDALANNTMGAREDPVAKRRADSDEVKRAQTERRALGVVPGEIGRQLSERFRVACDRFFQQHPPPPASNRAPRPRSDGAPRRRPRPRHESGFRDRS